MVLSPYYRKRNRLTQIYLPGHKTTSDINNHMNIIKRSVSSSRGFVERNLSIL